MLLTDALRPPDGYRVDVAVATTYSLDLTALLLAPLSFAVFDQERSDDLDRIDPIQLLEAVRRHSDHTTVFCQAGAIHVPAAYRRMLTFVEGSVHSVMPPADGHIFHPKIWAIRYTNIGGRRLHRVLCLSRNLTFDRSWDTALRLEEASDGADGADSRPVSDFLLALPRLCVSPAPPERQRQIEDLAATLSGIRLAPPAPFDSMRFMPFGVGNSPWPFVTAPDRLLAITPFASKSQLARLSRSATRRRLVSRPETLDSLGSKALDGWSASTLQRAAEAPEGEDIDRPQPAVTEWQRAPEGLHAKTFVCDVGDRAVVITGSANLTGAAFGGNVEFDVVLEGPRRLCGVASVLDGTKEAPGLESLLVPYSVTDPDGVTDEAQESAWRLEMLHQRLAGAAPVLHVTAIDQESVGMRLDAPLSADLVGTTTLRPLTLAEHRARVLGVDALDWTPISRSSITPFLVVDSVLGEGAAKASRRCVLPCELTGAVGDRRRDAVREVLRSKDDVLRYLVFLLGDPAYESLFQAVDGGGDGRFGEGAVGSYVEVALLEPLVRAAGRDDDAIARVASLVRELASMEDGGDLMPAGFHDLWDVVWQVHREGLQG